MEWNFNREESRTFEIIPVGKYRVRIAGAERKVSSGGNDMLTLKLDVSGHTGKIFHNIPFLPDNPSMTNRMLTQVYDSFDGIELGNLDESTWIGKVGACQVKHDEWPVGSGDKQAKVHYFISKDKQGDLPPWVEPNNGENVQVPAADDGFVSAMNAKVPF